MTVTTIPTLDLDFLENFEEGTEEYGNAVLATQMRYVRQIIHWALECHVQGLLKGKHNQGRGCDINRVALMIEEVMKNEEPATYEMLMTDYNEEMTVLQFMTIEVVKFMQKEGEVTYDDGNLFPNWEIELEEEDATVTLDGINYPLVTEMAPGDIIHFTENPQLFFTEYPTGKFDMVRTTAQHLIDGKVTVVQHEMKGKQLYMYAAN